MITLPTEVTQSSAAGNAGSLVSPDAQRDAQALPQGFITELGSRLLALVKQQGTAEQPAALSTESDKKNVTKASFNALLQALDKPGALNTLFQLENTKAGLKSADDKDKPRVSSFNASDLQNVQALFAMLPAAVLSESNGVSGRTDAVKTTAGSTDSLNRALLQGVLLQTEQDSGLKKNGTALNAFDQAADATNAHQADSLSATSPTNSTSVSLDQSFKQVLNALSRPEENHNAQVSPDVATPLTSAPLNSSMPLANMNGSANATPVLNAQLGSHEWQQALSQQIVMFSRNGQQNAELRLHPEDLGAIQISLSLNKDQAQLNLASSHSQVRAALEAALPQLRTALAESGINLGQSNVSSDAFAQSQNYHGQQEGRREGKPGSFILSRDSDNEITPGAVPAALQAHATGNGAVDIFA